MKNKAIVGEMELIRLGMTEKTIEEHKNKDNVVAVKEKEGKTNPVWEEKKREAKKVE